MKKKLEIYTETVFEVFNPWTAKTLAFFYNPDDANLFKDKWEKENHKKSIYEP